jgi:divalent metal cation (Fe/Co/Zn/Cd) transporter
MDMLVESFVAFIAAVIVVILGLFILYHVYDRIIHPVKAINPEITILTLLATGTISLNRTFRVRIIAKKFNIIKFRCQKIHKGRTVLHHL